MRWFEGRGFSRRRFARSHAPNWHAAIERLAARVTARLALVNKIRNCKRVAILPLWFLLTVIRAVASKSTSAQDCRAYYVLANSVAQRIAAFRNDDRLISIFLDCKIPPSMLFTRCYDILLTRLCVSRDTIYIFIYCRFERVCSVKMRINRKQDNFL